MWSVIIGVIIGRESKILLKKKKNMHKSERAVQYRLQLLSLGKRIV